MSGDKRPSVASTQSRPGGGAAATASTDRNTATLSMRAQDFRRGSGLARVAAEQNLGQCADDALGRVLSECADGVECDIPFVVADEFHEVFV